jgi:hypothetical protein
MTTAPNKIGGAQTLAKLLTATPAMAARQGLALIGRETLWCADVLVRLTISVLVLRAVTRLTASWLFPRDLWNQSEALLKGFEGTEEPPPSGERPRLIHEMSGWRFYTHRQQYNGQEWVCPLLKPEPCAHCEWVVLGTDGRNWCAAVAKVRTLGNEHFKAMDLYDLHDELVRTYGDRRQRSTNGTTADPSRSGCL